MHERNHSFIDRAGTLPLLGRDGESQTLASVALPGPTLILFLRHFGCVGCEAQVTSVLPRQPELTELGVKIVLVGNGPPEHLRAFVERHGLDERPVVVLTDPSLQTFDAAGLRRSAWATFGPRGIASELLAIGAGHVPRRRYGDRYQQGGALLLDERGAVVFHHENRFIGDCADVADVIDAALRLRCATDASGAASLAERGVV